MCGIFLKERQPSTELRRWPGVHRGNSNRQQYLERKWRHKGITLYSGESELFVQIELTEKYITGALLYYYMLL